MHLFDSAKNNSESWVDFFAWLGADGKLIWSSNINETTYQEYNGTDLSFRPYFSVPKSTHEPYYSSVIESVDNVPRIFVSVPIMSNTGIKAVIVLLVILIIILTLRPTQTWVQQSTTNIQRYSLFGNKTRYCRGSLKGPIDPRISKFSHSS